MRDAGRIATSRAQPPGIRSARRSDIANLPEQRRGQELDQAGPRSSRRDPSLLRRLADTCHSVIPSKFDKLVNKTSVIRIYHNQCDISRIVEVLLTVVHRGSRPARRVENALRSVLPASVRLQAVQKAGSSIDVRVAGRRLTAQWLETGMPGEVRALLANHARSPDVVVARKMSPGAREALSQRGIGWVDELGAAEITIGTIVVSRTGRVAPPSRRERRWTPAVLSIAEALLCDVQATVHATREATGLSVGACTYALRILTELGLLRATAGRGRRSGRHVADPDKLLATYVIEAAAAEPRPSLVVGVTWRDPVAGLTDLGRRWTHQDIVWAATGSIAAAVLAPLLTSVGATMVYVDVETLAELDALASRSDLRPIEGGRLTLAAFPTTTTRRLARTAGGLRVAPWPRVYVDLRAIGVRGEEAADHLLEVIRGR